MEPSTSRVVVTVVAWIVAAGLALGVVFVLLAPPTITFRVSGQSDDTAQCEPVLFGDGDEQFPTGVRDPGERSTSDAAPRCNLARQSRLGWSVVLTLLAGATGLAALRLPRATRET